MRSGSGRSKLRVVTASAPVPDLLDCNFGDAYKEEKGCREGCGIFRGHGAAVSRVGGCSRDVGVDVICVVGIMGHRGECIMRRGSSSVFWQSVSLHRGQGSQPRVRNCAASRT